MEFKDDTEITFDGDSRVDIGTEWNLKLAYYGLTDERVEVDIGTEWNLKEKKPKPH